MVSITIGMDLGDKEHVVCVLDITGNVTKSSVINNSQKTILRFFKKYKSATVALEAGTHSPWISRLLLSIGCNVLVG